MWQKILSAMLMVLMTALIGCSTQRHKECCICNSFRYHAPCLVDLETGEMIELALYEPHSAKAGELAEEQAETDTFSFVRLGNVTGTKLTGSRTIEIKVPTADQISDPALCDNCREKLQEGYNGRYVLADLYDPEQKALFTIEDGKEMVLRCYDITASTDLENSNLIICIRGILDAVG